ncbi:MAG: hypothetical protein ACI4IF_00870 [Acutalibacteraceae bacterium]
MKKSYDYFKNIKILTECINSITAKLINGDDYKKDVLTFKGVKNEITEYLKNDFITPVDRGDIFILLTLLEKELTLLERSKNSIDLSVSGLISKQNKSFKKLNSNKDYLSVFNSCTESVLSINNQIKSNCFNYELLNCILDVNINLQRIMIDNI